jgi:hypothetical protein
VPVHVIQARLGHKTPKMLLTHYAALNAAMEASASQAIADVLRATGTGG